MSKHDTDGSEFAQCPLCVVSLTSDADVDRKNRTMKSKSVVLGKVVYHVTCLLSSDGKTEHSQTLVKLQSELHDIDAKIVKVKDQIKAEQSELGRELGKLIKAGHDKSVIDAKKAEMTKLNETSGFADLGIRKSEIREAIQEWKNAQQLIAEFSLMVSGTTVVSAHSRDEQRADAVKQLKLLKKQSTNLKIQTSLTSLIDIIENSNRSHTLALSARRVFDVVASQHFYSLREELGDVKGINQNDDQTINSFVTNCQEYVKHKLNAELTAAQTALKLAVSPNDKTVWEEKVTELEKDIASPPAIEQYNLMESVLCDFVNSAGHFSAKVHGKTDETGWIWSDICTRILNVFGALAECGSLDVKLSNDQKSTTLLNSSVVTVEDRKAMNMARAKLTSVASILKPESLKGKFACIKTPSDQVNCLALWRIITEVKATTVTQSRILLLQLRILEETLCGVLIRARIGAAKFPSDHKSRKKRWISKFSSMPVKTMYDHVVCDDWNTDTEHYLSLSREMRNLVLQAVPVLLLVKAYGDEAQHPHQGKSVWEAKEKVSAKLAEKFKEAAELDENDMIDTTITSLSRQVYTSVSKESQWGLYLVPPLMELLGLIVTQYLKLLNKHNKPQ